MMQAKKKACLVCNFVRTPFQTRQAKIRVIGDNLYHYRNKELLVGKTSMLSRGEV